MDTLHMHSTYKERKDKQYSGFLLIKGRHESINA